MRLLHGKVFLKKAGKEAVARSVLWPGTAIVKTIIHLCLSTNNLTTFSNHFTTNHAFYEATYTFSPVYAPSVRHAHRCGTGRQF